MVDPFGTVGWDHITVMSAYKSSGGEKVRQGRPPARPPPPPLPTP